MYVAGQSNRLQIVVNLGQIKVIRTLVDVVFVGAPSDRRRRLSVVSRDLSFSISWTGKRRDVTVHVLVSRVAGDAIGSRSTLPTSEVSLEDAAGFPATSLPGPPSARFFGVDGYPVDH